MGLSPSTLFHFTSKIALKGILKSNFRLKYCFEEIGHINDPIKIAVPMVSFCDIKISEIKEHIEKYGYYGLGLSKEWAFEKNLNPVVYMSCKSTLYLNLISSIRKTRDLEGLDPETYFHLSNIIRYAKRYEGNLIRDGRKIEKYRFADEREWRYVPELFEINEFFLPWLIEDQYNTNEKKITANNRLQNQKLTFNSNQILYIIVKEEEEINEIIDYIRSAVGEKYTMAEVDRLTTRILSCERILNDF